MSQPMPHNDSCDRLRLSLHALADEQITAAESPTLQAHLADCAACRRELETIRLLGAEIRAQLPIHTASEYLRQRIEARLPMQKPDSAFRRRLRPPVGFAGAGWLIAAIAVIFILSQQHSRTSFPASAFVDDHVHYLKNRELAQVNLSDPVALEKWFGERVDFHPVVPPLNNATLMGGRVCKVAGERVVLAFWTCGNETITVFTRQDSHNIDLSAMPEIQAAGRSMRTTSAEGFNLILWRENGLLYVLVTDHPQHDLTRFAQKLFS
jgi:anti-sigma factor RsiW